MNEKKIILTMSDSPKSSTGYGQVMDNLLSRWVKKYGETHEFYHVGWQSFERPHKREEGYTVLPRNKMDYGYDVVLKYIQKYNPDIFMTLCDVGFQEGFINIMKQAHKAGWTGTWVGYFPIDSHVCAYNWKQAIENIDLPVTMAQFGHDTVLKNLGIETIMIPHGVDINIYKPLEKEERDKIRKEAGLDSKFVILGVGRNQNRKRWDTVIKSFSEFAKDKDDVLLLLHTERTPPNGDWNAGYDLDYHVRKHGCEGKVQLTKENLEIWDRVGLQPEDMSKLYNLADIFCMASAEGFGLPILEAVSCGLPVIFPDYTTGQELVGGHGKLIPTLKDSHERVIGMVGCNGVEFAFTDDKEMTKALQEYYNDWKGEKRLITEHAKLAREHAVKNYNWDDIADKWIELFNKTK